MKSKGRKRDVVFKTNYFQSQATKNTVELKPPKNRNTQDF